MSILDADISDSDNAYRTFVAGAPELVAEVSAWWVATQGGAPSIHDLHHVWWRMIEERRRWGTPRNALESREGTGQPRPTPSPEQGLGGSGPASIRPGQPILVTPGPCHPRFYSYWANVWLNPHDGATYVFAGKVPQRPTFWRVSKSGHVDELGPLLAFPGETECWYWDVAGRVCLPDGPRLVRANPFDGQTEVLFDVSTKWPGTRIWQAHSSADGRVHCATLQSTETWQKVATVIARDGQLHRLDARQELDESDVDASGQWVLIKEGSGPDNRIVHVPTMHEKFLEDGRGAMGHCSMGTGFVVGEADKPGPGRCVQIDLDTLERRDLFPTWNMGHTAVRGSRCLVSHGQARELAIVDLRTGTYERLPIELPEWEPGNYDRQVRANLSPDGSRVCYMHAGTVYLLAL